jgi:ABC-type transporter Mla MlaB component
MPVFGSVGCTAMLYTFGGKSHLAGVVYALTVLVVSVTALSALQYLPKCALGLIVVSAVLKVFDFAEVMKLFRTYRVDFWVWVLTLTASCFIGISEALLLALLFNTLSHARRSFKPDCFVEGRLPGTTRFVPLVENGPSLHFYPGLMVLRFDAPLYFGNENFLSRNVAFYMNHPESIRQGLVIDVSSVDFVDASGMHMLEELMDQFQTRGLVMVLAGFSPRVFGKFTKWGLVRKFGLSCFYFDVSEAVVELLHGSVVAHGEEDNEKESARIKSEARTTSRIQEVADAGEHDEESGLLLRNASQARARASSFEGAVDASDAKKTEAREVQAEFLSAQAFMTQLTQAPSLLVSGQDALDHATTQAEADDALDGAGPDKLIDQIVMGTPLMARRFRTHRGSSYTSRGSGGSRDLYDSPESAMYGSTSNINLRTTASNYRQRRHSNKRTASGDNMRFASTPLLNNHQQAKLDSSSSSSSEDEEEKGYRRVHAKSGSYKPPARK